MNTNPLIPILIALARSGLTGQPVPEPTRAALPGDSWDDLTALAEAHGLLGLIGAGAAASGIALPGETRTLLRRTSRLAGMRADRAWAQIAAILDAWQGEGIEAIALKGVLLALRHYKAPGLRPFGDLDLLVPPQQRDQAAAVLLRLGYRCTDDLDAGGKAWCLANHFHWKFMREGAFPVELHWSLTFTFPPTPADLQTLRERTCHIATPAGAVRGLGAEDEVLALAAHMTSHCFRLPLRCHMDFAAILRDFTPEQWSRLWERAVEMGQERDLLAVLGVGNALGMLDLPAALAARAGADRSLDLPFLARYAAECPFMAAPERWLDVQNAPSRRAALGRLWRVAFPRYTHLWTPKAEARAGGRPLLVYGAAWTRRTLRLLRHLRDLPGLAADCRRTSRVHRMFGARRRKVSP